MATKKVKELVATISLDDFKTQVEDRMDYFPEVSETTQFVVAGEVCTVKTRQEKECLYLINQTTSNRVRISVTHLLGQFQSSFKKALDPLFNKQKKEYQFREGYHFVVTQYKDGGLTFDHAASKLDK